MCAVCICVIRLVCCETCTYEHIIHNTFRNISKRAKTTRHEKEKAYTEQLRCAGAIVGEYVGNGQGESECVEDDNLCDEQAEPVAGDGGCESDSACEEEASEDTDDNAPLLFIYDCETTGLGIYTEHITEIAAKVVRIPLSSVSNPTFASLVKTSRNISKKGIVQ